MAAGSVRSLGMGRQVAAKATRPSSRPPTPSPDLSRSPLASAAPPETSRFFNGEGLGQAGVAALALAATLRQQREEAAKRREGPRRSPAGLESSTWCVATMQARGFSF